MAYPSAGQYASLHASILARAMVPFGISPASRDTSLINEPRRSCRVPAGPANAQLECPLYSILPTEIRDVVWELALTASDDKEKPYKENSHFYRPGSHYHPKIETNLLLTCRLVYQETRLLPLSANEHTFWRFNGPGPLIPDGRSDNWERMFGRLTPEQKNAVGTVRLFAQQWYLEKMNFDQLPPHALPTCRRFKITIRHGDWWSRESPVGSNDRLGMCPWRFGRTTRLQMEHEPLHKNLRAKEPGTHAWNIRTWAGQLQLIKGLQFLEMEFEIDVKKKAQLEFVIERAKHWVLPYDDAHDMVWTGDIRESQWTGLATLYSHFDPRASSLRPALRDTRTRTYYVASMTWRVTPVSDSGASG